MEIICNSEVFQQGVARYCWQMVLLPKWGCFDQGLFYSVFFMVPQNVGIYCIKKGVVFKMPYRGFRGSCGFKRENRTIPLLSNLLPGF